MEYLWCRLFSLECFILLAYLLQLRPQFGAGFESAENA